tara:strand:+ start:2307 stop:3179 length:873 start_codon:yes stop_codon:yes gene_type:complete
MSTSKPPGSQFEKVAQKKNNLPILVIILLGVHLVALGGMLWSGCKPQPENVAEADPPGSVLPPLGGTNESPFFGPIGEAPNPSDVSVPPTPPGVVPAPEVVTSQNITPPPGTSTSAPPAEPRMPTPAPTPTPPPGVPGAGPEISTPTVPSGPTDTSTPPTPGPGTGSSIQQPAAPAATAMRTHVVGRGDTFFSIAGEYGASSKDIQAANPSVDPRRLQLGQKLKIPAARPTSSTPPAQDSTIYVVKSGDMLGKIARKFKTSVKRLREVNNLPSDRIRVGQKLKLPVESLQ